MRRPLLAAVLATAGLAAQAQPAPSPAARPRGEPASQTSVPSAAPPAGTAQVTGSTAQNPVVKEMNEAEKAKVQSQGK